ncbi:MAG: FixH family protein [Thermodesulfovibrionales bacterium]|nr:FixH family protein [Thermodesulfovibrionales bacterium]
MKLTLTIVTLIGIFAVVGAIVMGNMSFDGVVVEHPYERGLQWDKENALREASGLDVRVLSRELPKGEAWIEFLVRHKDGSAYEGPVELELTRPETTAMDRSYTTSALGGGRFAARVELPLEGAWDLMVSLSSVGNTVVFTRRVNVLSR